MISTLPGNPTVIHHENREQWAAGRIKRLGCSETSAAIGQNPFCSAFTLWASKCELLPPDELIATREAMLWGTLLEPTVIQEFGRRTNREVVPHNQCDVLVHPQYEFLSATLDAIQFDNASSPEPGDLQVKTTSHWMADEWADGQVPLHVQIQIQSELAVTGMEWGSVACLIGGQRLVYRDMRRDDEFIAALLPHLVTFWRHVETRMPPPVDASPITAKVLQKLHPNDNGLTIDLPPESAGWHSELLAARETIKTAEATKTLNENRFKAAIGDATFGQLTNGLIYSLKTQQRAEFISKATTFRVLRALKGE